MRYPLTDVLSPSSPCNTNLQLLMGAYHARLHYVASHRLRYVSTSVLDADDAVSTAFTYLWQGLSEGKFSITSDTDAWYVLKMLTLKACRVQIDYLRWAKRSSLITQALDDATADGIVGADPDPILTLSAADMLSVCLSRLSDLDRQILSYRLEGWDQAETAEELGIDPSYVSKRMLSIRHVVSALNCTA